MGNYMPSFLEELTQDHSFSFDLDQTFQPHAAQISPSREKESRVEPTSGRGKRRSTRDKYIPKACQACQRRKVKCSGESICYNCRSRNVACVYLPRAYSDGKRKRPVTNSETHDDHQAEPDVVKPFGTNENVSIEERISRLQEQVKKFSEASRQSQDDVHKSRLTISSSALYTVDLAFENGEETDTFNNGSGCNNLSLSAQIAEIQRLLGVKTTLSRRTSEPQGRNRIFPLELPSPARIRYLMQVYFREMNSYFPFLDQSDTETRVIQTLNTLGRSEFDLIIDVDSAHHPIIALLCNILAMGECMDPEVTAGEESRPGWVMYTRGRKLLQHCGSPKVVDMDLIRYHTLSALYMMDSELLQSAGHAISTAVQSAMVARLNDQSLWGECTAAEKEARKRLWWTIYFLDRRIAQRNGTPYLIRDTDNAVDEFGTLQGTRRPSLTSIDPESQGMVESSHTASYLQSLIDFGRLWGHIWDTFYAASVPKNADWKQIALTDTRILIFRRQLPPELTWETDRVKAYLTAGETEQHVRRRLAISIRINLLRMIVRQNPVLSCDGDDGARHFCAMLSRASIDAIGAFISACPRIRAAGYFLCTALVECIYHLVYILKDRDLPVDRPTVLESFRKAYQLLLSLASTCITGKRALNALSSTIYSGGDADALFAAISNPQNEESEKADDTPHDGNINSDIGVSSNSNANLFDQLFPLSPSGKGPTMTQLSNQILQHGSQQSAQLDFSMFNRQSEFIPDFAGTFDHGNLDGVDVFSV